MGRTHAIRLGNPFIASIQQHHPTLLSNMKSFSLVAVLAFFLAFSAADAANVTVRVGVDGGLNYVPGQSSPFDSDFKVDTDRPFYTSDRDDSPRRHSDLELPLGHARRRDVRLGDKLRQGLQRVVRISYPAERTAVQLHFCQSRNVLLYLHGWDPL